MRGRAQHSRRGRRRLDRSSHLRSNEQQRSRAGPSGGLSRAPEGPGGPPNRAERAPDSGQTGGTVSSLENRTGQRTEPAH